ncbi:MAG TPA: hypothetical protein VFJ98_06845 [Mycobacteriales bacterium]|nr:hypothetical protein [Mycobacteriales bacterium]
MSQIEELLRQALSETPAATTVHDPLAAVDRRVRRARARIAAGAGVGVAAVAAAVIVPLTVAGSSRGADGLQVGHSPSPTPAATHGGPPASEAVTTVDAPGPISSVAVSADGRAYAAGSWQVSSGAAFVGQVQGGKLTHVVTVPGPADAVIADMDVAWVYGTDRTGRSRLTAVYLQSGGTAPDDALPGRILSATAAADSLFVLTATPQGTEVDRFVTDNQGLALVDDHPVAGAKRLVTDAAGQAWVQTGRQLIPLLPEAQTFSFGHAVPWPGGQPVYGPALPSGVWAYDGRLIELSPPLLANGTSVAEGWRLNTNGVPSAAVSAPGGGAYYGIRSAAAGSDSGVFYYSRRAMTDGAARPDDRLAGVGVAALAVDPDGGVLLVTTSGKLQHWTPAQS